MFFIHFLEYTAFSSNGVNHLSLALVMGSVFFEVRTKFLNIVYTTFGFKGLILAVLTSLGAHFRLTLSIQPGRFP